MNKKKKNGTIEFLRFIFCMIVFFYHIQKHILGGLPSLKNGIHISFFANGAMGVEFFFLVSGFLMAKSIVKSNKEEKINFDNLGKDTWLFLFKKWVSIFPYHLVAFILLFIQVCVINNYNLIAIIKNFIDTIPHIFLFYMSGISFYNPNYVVWYISSMFLSMFILYPICKRYYSNFVKIIAPILCVFLLGQLIYYYDSLTGVMDWTIVGYKSIIRAIIEISMGVIAHEISVWLSGIKITNLKKNILKILEICCYLCVVFYMLCTFSRHYEFYCLLVLFVSIIITFSGITSSGRMNNKVIYFLGKASLPIYLSQVFAINLVNYMFVNYSDIERVILTILIDFLLSFVVYFLGEKLRKIIFKLKNNMEIKDDDNLVQI